MSVSLQTPVKGQEVSAEISLTANINVTIPEHIDLNNKELVAAWVYTFIRDNVSTEDLIAGLGIIKYNDGESFGLDSVSVFDEIPGPKTLGERTTWFYQKENYWNQCESYTNHCCSESVTNPEHSCPLGEPFR